MKHNLFIMTFERERASTGPRPNVLQLHPAVELPSPPATVHVTSTSVLQFDTEAGVAAAANVLTDAMERLGIDGIVFGFHDPQPVTSDMLQADNSNHQLEE